MNELISIIGAIIGGGGIGAIVSHVLSYRQKKTSTDQEYHLRHTTMTLEQYERLLKEREREIQRLTGRIEALENLLYSHGLPTHEIKDVDKSA